MIKIFSKYEIYVAKTIALRQKYKDFDKKVMEICENLNL